MGASISRGDPLNQIREWELNSNLTIEQLPKHVKRNLDLWRQTWRNRCDLFKESGEGIYSRHILSFLPDLLEEITYNEGAFSRNAYARSYFAVNLEKYFLREGRNASAQSTTTFSQKFAWRIRRELGLVLEALGRPEAGFAAFGLAHLLDCIRGIDAQLRNSESCDLVVESLVELICSSENIAEESPDVIEASDSLMLLFWRKGNMPESLVSLASTILAGIERIGHSEVYSSYPALPERAGATDEQYEKSLRSFFAKLTKNDRFGEIKKMYRRETKSYEVIFKVDGFERGSSNFSIGDVAVYDPLEGPHIKRSPVESGELDILGMEKVEGGQLCVAVKVQGSGSGSMKLEARRKAERALGLLTVRKQGRRPLTLSTAFAVLDSSGMEVAGGSEVHKLGVSHPSFLSEWTKEEYSRMGEWLRDDFSNQSVREWLASMDWHRKAIESLQSSEALLNAWFSIEHLFQGRTKIPLRVPGFLRNRPAQSHTQGPWYPLESIAAIQLILSLVATRYEMIDYVNKVATDYLPSSRQFFKLKYGKDFALPKDLIDKFQKHGTRGYNPGDFVAISDLVAEHLERKQVNGALIDVGAMRRLFYDHEFAMSELRREIWRIKDDT